MEPFLKNWTSFVSWVFSTLLALFFCGQNFILASLFTSLSFQMYAYDCRYRTHSHFIKVSTVIFEVNFESFLIFEIILVINSYFFIFFFRKYKVLKMLQFLLTSIWILAVIWIFKKFSVLSYGITPLSAVDVIKLRWKNSWDFIIHKQVWFLK